VLGHLTPFSLPLSWSRQFRGWRLSRLKLHPPELQLERPPTAERRSGNQDDYCRLRERQHGLDTLDDFPDLISHRGIPQMVSVPFDGAGRPSLGQQCPGSSAGDRGTGRDANASLTKRAARGLGEFRQNCWHVIIVGMADPWLSLLKAG
jgi:hypothetical protein